MVDGIERRDPSELAPSESHVRRDHEEPGEQLRQSVQAVGIVEPPIGRNESGDLRLIDGVRRARAAAAEGVEEIPVLVRCLDDSEALEQSIQLNRRSGTASNKHVTDSDRDRALERLTSQLDADRDDVEREIGLLSEADLIERELDDVPGVGRTIAERLADRWTLEELRDPSEHTPVSGVQGVGDSLSRAIHEHLNPPVRSDGGEAADGVEDTPPTPQSIRERTNPRRMALPCIYEEVDRLVDLRGRAAGELLYAIEERFSTLGYALEDRTQPRYPDCPNCSAELQIRMAGVVSCENCLDDLPEAVADDYWQQHNRLWGSRGHGGDAREGDNGD